MGAFGLVRNFTDISGLSTESSSSAIQNNSDANLLVSIEADKKREFDRNPLTKPVECAVCFRPKPQCICKHEEEDEKENKKSVAGKTSSNNLKAGMTSPSDRVKNLLDAKDYEGVMQFLSDCLVDASPADMKWLKPLAQSTYNELKWENQADDAQVLDAMFGGELSQNWEAAFAAENKPGISGFTPSRALTAGFSFMPSGPAFGISR